MTEKKPEDFGVEKLDPKRPDKPGVEQRSGMQPPPPTPPPPPPPPADQND